MDKPQSGQPGPHQSNYAEPLPKPVVKDVDPKTGAIEKDAPKLEPKKVAHEEPKTKRKYTHKK